MGTHECVFITGGTGSFGQAYVRHLLKKNLAKRIIIYSRDEMKQWDMALSFNDPRLKFVIGDVRDKERLLSASVNCDLLTHAAATKIVPTAETNPIECIKTNIEGAHNVTLAAAANKIPKVIALSTDKASNPINLYGATKLASDKLFIAQPIADSQTRFSVVRYGNVIASRGSVIPYFRSLPSQDPTPITDVRMTRFMISLKQAVAFVSSVSEDMKGGEIYIPKIPSMSILDIAEAIRPGSGHIEVGIRPGEKLHEQMISEDEALCTYEYSDHYKILPMTNDLLNDPEYRRDGVQVKAGFKYSSDTNCSWMTQSQLLEIVNESTCIG